jgi:hemerythrin-like domain-containing protein
MATKKKARTASSRKHSSTSKDAISLLKQDHEKVRGLLKRLESAADRGSDTATQLVAQLDRELKIHTQIEEEIFYPAFKEAARSKEDNKMFFEAKEEHHVVDMVFPEVRAGGEGAEDFAAKAKVLKDLVEHHAEEEETEMFPKARKLMGRDQLQELGRRLKERKQELQQE